MRHANDFLFI